MVFARRAVLVGCVIFAGCMVGVLLQSLLPTQHLADAKGAITTIQGLVSLLLALVLGFLIWTSYGVYSQQQSEALTLGSQILQLDLALDRYGPEADRGRELLKKEMVATRERFWGENGDWAARLWRIARRIARLRRLLRGAQARHRRAAPPARRRPPIVILDRANSLPDVEAAPKPLSEGAADLCCLLGDASVHLRRRAVDHQCAFGRL